MAKDPAIMFYTQDFLTGVMFFSDAQTGIYIKLLCAQHQHGGIIPKDYFIAASKNDEQIKQKFIEVEEGFFNKRLMEEMEKRSNKSSNLSNNAKKRWEKYRIAMQMQSKSNAIASDLHMPIEDEDEDENVSSSLNLNSNVSNINNVNNICEAGNPEPVKKPKKEKSAFPTDSFEYQFSEKIYKSLTAGTGAIITPAKIQSGASVVDLMLRVDKRDGQWLENTLRAVLNAPERNGFAWHKVIKSPEKFRIQINKGQIHPDINKNSGFGPVNSGFKMRNDNFLDIPEA